MEQLNRVELIGAVGSVQTPGTNITTFTVATSFAYKDENGLPVIETTWHQVTGRNVPELWKGCKVHVIGRLRNRIVLDEDWEHKRITDVFASKVERIDTDETLTFQM